MQGRLHRTIDLCTHQWHSLRPATVVASGLHARLLHFLDQVGDSFFFTRRCRCPAFEFIRSQYLHMARKIACTDAATQQVLCRMRGNRQLQGDGKYKGRFQGNAPDFQQSPVYDTRIFPGCVPQDFCRSDASRELMG